LACQLFCQIRGSGDVELGKNQGILEVSESPERLNGSAGSYLPQAGVHLYLFYCID